MTITIIDFGIGNPGSILNMLKHIGVPAHLTGVPSEILEAEKLILPGIGAFDPGMARLNERGLVDVLNQKVIKERTPILGVCLGLQLFTHGSEEGSRPGLGWLDAEVVRFNFGTENTDRMHRLRVPHMGWNEIQTQRPHPLLKGLELESRFYFTHSYHVRCRESELVLATTNYGFHFHSVVGRGNILGVQFHPEKSHRYGMQLLKNYAGLRT